MALCLSLTGQIPHLHQCAQKTGKWLMYIIRRMWNKVIIRSENVNFVSIYLVIYRFSWPGLASDTRNILLLLFILCPTNKVDLHFDQWELTISLTVSFLLLTWFSPTTPLTISTSPSTGLKLTILWVCLHNLAARNF